MGLFTKLFGGADGCRETMRESYEKHAKLARQSGMDSPHAFGLYGALGSRYQARRLPVVEVVMWAELSPFLAMKEAEGIEAIAEYAVFQERPSDARQEWLRALINNALSAPSDSSLTTMAIGGLMNQVAWCSLLEPSTISAIERAVADD